MWEGFIHFAKEWGNHLRNYNYVLKFFSGFEKSMGGLMENKFYTVTKGGFKCFEGFEGCIGLFMHYNNNA